MAAIGPDTPAKGEIMEPGQWWQNQYARTAAAFLAWIIKLRKQLAT
jgi:hypothetical protein